jgi:hypothetical protein
MRSRLILCVMLIAIQPSVSLSAPVSVKINICDVALPVMQWSQCVGRYQMSTGDSYYGHFVGGRFDGVGRYTSREGLVFVGEFVAGRRQGRGVEYSRNGEVVRLGRWDNSFVEWISVTPSSFPFSGELAWLGDVGNAERSVESNYQSELARAYERIATLEAQLKEKERIASMGERGNAVPNRPSESRVKRCLSRGLSPGSPEFSRCVIE